MDRLKTTEQKIYDVIVEAGKIAESYFQEKFDVHDKSPGNPVTTADLAVDKFLRENLLSIDSCTWLSEESFREVTESRRSWIVDPLDGTKDFIDGRPEFTISVAWYEGDQPQVSAIYNPITKEIVSACGDEMVRVEMKPFKRNSDLPLCVVSRTETKDGLFAHGFDSYQLLSVGSIAYKMALVAAGCADCLLSQRPKSVWDVAAGYHLIQAAGGHCDLGKPQFWSKSTRLPYVVALKDGQPIENKDKLIALLQREKGV